MVRPTGKFIHSSQSNTPAGQTQTTFGFLPTQLVTPIIQAVGSLQDRWVKASDELSKVFQQYSGQAREEKEQELKQEKLTLANQINTKQEQIIDQETQKIINDISNQRLIIPAWFANNNVNWVISGQITKTEFLSGLQNLLDIGTAYYGTAPIITEPTPAPIITEPTPAPIITEPTPAPIIQIPELLPPVSAEPDITINDNMITQELINFNIVNGRAKGSIKFIATNNFNPYYYNKNIVNIIQIKDPNGVNILTTVKQNKLNFTATERDEVITYDEDVKQNTRVTVESFVWSSATQPTPFSKMYSVQISEAEPPKPIQSGFMGAGVVGAIAGLVLLGFIVDSKRGK